MHINEYIKDNQTLLQMVEVLESDLKTKEFQKDRALSALENISVKQYDHHKEIK